MERRAVVICPGCSVRLGIPGDQGPIHVECPQCGSAFRWDPMPPRPYVAPRPLVQTPDASPKRWWSAKAVAVGAIALLVAVLLYANRDDVATNPDSTATRSVLSPRPTRQARWISADYHDLVDRDFITHSKWTVGQLLSGTPAPSPLDPLLGERTTTGQRAAASNPPPVDSPNARADLQPQLEPFSFILNDLVNADQPPKGLPYVNAVADYAPGSAQPAWAALFREGHYQLFVGENDARLFLKGNRPEGLLRQDHDVVRHALLEALDRSGRDELSVRVYAFQNDYRSQTLRLDLEPAVEAVSRATLAPTKRAVPLPALASLLGSGGPLEAAELTEAGLVLFAKPRGDSPETIDGVSQSLADFAVVYRSVFHCEENAPYISLDTHEDNRRAKVNFGGLLADTHVGSVVLEADRLFKTLSTGLLPDSRQNVIAKLGGSVPGFLTEDERSFALDDEMGRQQIRYWFYPDRIRTVTDGHIAAVEACQFFADAEHTENGVTRPLGAAQRATIDHLNTHFEQYARAFRPFKELYTVGRMMAIVNWLATSDAKDSVDLDSLLSVRLPAVATSRDTQKMLAVSAVSMSGRGFGAERGETSVYPLDDFLAQLDPTVSDDEILDRAARHFNAMELKPALPPGIAAFRAEMEAENTRLDGRQAALRRLGQEIDGARAVLDRTSESAVAAFNSRVDRYESMRRSISDDIDSYNAKQRRANAMDIRSRSIVSVGGGISLEPQKFGKPVVRPDSPLLTAVRSSRSAVAGRVGSLLSSGSMTRAELPPAGQRLSGWNRVGDAGGVPTLEARWTRIDGSRASSAEAGRAVGIQTPTYFASSRPSGQPGAVVVRGSLYPAEIVLTGEIAPGRTVFLRRGARLSESGGAPVWVR